MLTTPQPDTLVKANWLEHFQHFLQLEVAQGSAADDTLKSYLAAIKQFLVWCADNCIHPLAATETELLEYRHWLTAVKEYSCASVALKLTALRRFYSVACKRGAITINPTLDLKPPREKRDPAERINYMEQSQAAELLASLPSDDSPRSLRDRLLVGIMLLQGCRTVEMHRLSVGDIVHRGRDVGLRVQGKRSLRIVPLTPDLAKLLTKYLQVRTSGGESLEPDTPMFISLAYRAVGQRLTRRSIGRIVDGYLRAVGMKPPIQPKSDKNPKKSPRQLSAHSLRHTAGTLALRTGAELRQVQDLLGHADPRTTALYAHIADRWRYNPALNMGVTVRV
jgi:integrase/recombinase XerD